MFARRPVRSRAPRILAVAVACGLAPIGCERTPTGSSGPSGAIADPTLLPDAAQPDRDLCFSFSNRPSQPRIAYVVHSGVLHRFNTETMQLENTGSFPRSVNAFAWLQHDRNDVWFVGLVDATTAFAWNSQTNQYLTHSETWLRSEEHTSELQHTVISY